jgi:hypothetical protein
MAGDVPQPPVLGDEHVETGSAERPGDRLREVGVAVDVAYPAGQGTSCAPAWKIVVSNPRSSRPCTTSGADGPVPPMTSAFCPSRPGGAGRDQMSAVSA